MDDILPGKPFPWLGKDAEQKTFWLTVGVKWRKRRLYPSHFVMLSKKATQEIFSFDYIAFIFWF
jgi:hypothetical protein